MIKNQLMPQGYAPQPQTPAPLAPVSYQVGGATVNLDWMTVKNFLVSGDAKNVTDQEVAMFMNLCKYQKLNPFVKEAYLVKYGSSPASIITGKGAMEKRANRNENFEGFDAGVIVVNLNGQLEYRDGEFVLPEERLVGGWCKVYVKGYTHPVKASVSLAEYSTGKSTWAAKPATMIRKVAKMHALREAFPEDLEGLYGAEEMQVDEQQTPPPAVYQEPQQEFIPEYVPSEPQYSEPPVYEQPYQEPYQEPVYEQPKQPVQPQVIQTPPPQQAAPSQPVDDFADIMMG